MNEIYSIELFKEAIEFYFRSHFCIDEENDDEIIYSMDTSVFGDETYKVIFNKNELNKCIDSLNNNCLENQSIYLNGMEYETLINFSQYERGRMFVPLRYRLESEEGKYNVNDGNIDISVNKISNTFNLYLFLEGYKKSKSNSLYSISRVSIRECEKRIRFIKADYNDSSEICKSKEIDGFDIIRDHRVLALKITSNTELSKEKFIDYQYSYLFNISLNYDVTYINVENYTHSFVINRERNVKKIKRNDLILDVPRKKYIKDIIKYYTNAKIIDNLPSKYLSYYHILEYFFEDVHYEDMIRNVKFKISNPEFSLKDDNSVKNLIKFFEDKITNKKGDGTAFNEKNALRLTIEKYIPLEDIESKLSDNSEELVRYFKNEKCSFSDAKKIDFVNVQTIVNRIYKNRNALVHSKNTNIERYRPFKDEVILEKEIELIKVMSEILIINSAELI